MAVDISSWVEEHERAFEQAGIHIEAVPPDPLHAGRSKIAQSVRTLTGREMAEVIVWSSGECEVLRGEDPASVTVEQHRVASQAEFSALMAQLFPAAMRDDD